MLSTNSDMVGGTGTTLGARLKHALINNADTISITIPDSTGGTISQNVRKLNAFMATSATTFTSSTVTSGISIAGFRTGFTLPSNTNLLLPTEFAPLGTSIQQAVTTIGSSAFAYQLQLNQVTIPSGVATVGTNAFLNTGGAPIYIQGRDIAPSTFHYNWNPSTNPVYLNGVYCDRSTATLTNLSSTVHGIMCPISRTTTNIENHSFALGYTWVNYKQHRGFCECGASHFMGHVVSSSDPGYPYKTCLLCGGPAEMGFVIDGLASFVLSSNSVSVAYNFGEGSYVLSNGVIVLSEIDTERYLNGDFVLPDIEECLTCADQEEYHLQRHETEYFI
jgi:hypothetical protein